MQNNFERELPDGYRQAAYINVKKASTGIVLNLLALVPLIIAPVVAGAMVADRFSEDFLAIPNLIAVMLKVLVMGVLIWGYIVLHELVHALVYRITTGEKPTFGITWSAAFCGVPNIFVYRRAALVSVLAPFVLFTVIFSALSAWLYYVDAVSFILSALLWGVHVGGCVGDLLVTGVFLFKVRSKTALLRDTGPEQTFYEPIEK